MSPIGEAVNSYTPITEYKHTFRDIGGGLMQMDSIIPDGETRDSFRRQVLDLQVVYYNAAEEAKKRPPLYKEFDNLETADFSGVQYVGFPSTGDSDMDYAIKLGMDYMQSCFEGCTIHGDYMLQEISKTEDLSEMTSTEKYKAIYEKYQKCYGENFLYSEACNFMGCLNFVSNYERITNNFRNEVRSACGESCDMAKLRRRALYPDMSETEIRNSIVEKFDKSDGITTIELNQMAYEMKICGIDGGLHNVMHGMMIYRDNGQLGTRQYADKYNKEMHSNVTSKYMNDLKIVCGNLCPGNSKTIETWSFLNSLVIEANGRSGTSIMDQYKQMQGIKL